MALNVVLEVFICKTIRAGAAEDARLYWKRNVGQSVLPTEVYLTPASERGQKPLKGLQPCLIQGYPPPSHFL